MARKRIAIVVQRYGPEVLGGSESLARSLAHLLSDVYDIDVLTTCAKDYVTWKNEFPAGESMDGPVRVLRFKVDRQRSKWFNIYNALMLKVPHTRWMEELWMRMQGPYSSDFLNYLDAAADNYQAFIFMTYMYGTTYYGSKKVKGRYLLVPTAHDEPFIRFRFFQETFGSSRHVVCLTDEELVLVKKNFRLRDDRLSVIGVPIGECLGDSRSAVEKYGITGNFIAYIGRIDVMKGVDTLVKYFNRYASESDSELSLVLCGSGPLKIPSSEKIYQLGFIPEADKFGIMHAALATVQPSRYESYSISVIESMACSTPVLVNGECAVLKGHCEKSGGGMTFFSYEDFKSSMDRLINDADLRQRMSLLGIAYVNENYSCDVVGKKYISLLDGLTTKP
ncbi:glycosyltransferase family 4 protein [Methanocella arvoryzae]|uniref:Glycosyltransferase (Group 1) n=1 Tax=Methanocella arvoryzae (strain DSM 22066 / NBRC 105507 / MRE50) TaxID=351160 RepID=Q0W7E6_METAR|nr:glycosyltransferase family 4 protein [Methanocella arvoryzae]CAJ35697.1 putative glycosyltransferase (group 1) [Methanocella arvoryzae MRE50]